MTKILCVSDDGVSSGFGRIAMHGNTGLIKRGYHIMAASLQYDGLLPANYEGSALPYHVASLAGHDWIAQVAALISVYQPDIVMVIQDAPYGEAVRNLQLDWSKYAFIMITPVDGDPIFPPWVDTMKKADAALTISKFGVTAYAKAGVTAGLCQPGIEPDVFYRMPDDARNALRTKLGLAADSFVLGMAAQNQGRKDIPDTLRAFYQFAADKPSARLLLDMDAVSPAGWNIPAMCQQFGWDAGKIIFRVDAMRAGLTHIRERYNVMDVHAVMSHREGFGLPLVESQACGVATMALDWCSGTEIVGDGKGLLIPPIAYTSVSTWGNALDKFPDLDHMVSELQRMHDHPDERSVIARRGMEWAREQLWSKAVDNVVSAIERVVVKRQQMVAPAPVLPTMPAQTPPPMPVSVDGMQPTQAVQLVEAK